MNPLEDLNKDSDKRVKYPVFQSASSVPVLNHLSTGSFILDLALLGGVPDSLCSLFIGKQHAGKTLMAFKTVASFQKKYDGINGPKKYALWVNLGEGAFPVAWAKINGVNTDELLLMVPPDGEVAIDLLCSALENPAIGFVVVDAIPGLVGGKEIEKSISDPLAPGAVAVLLSRLLRKAGTIIAKAYHQGDNKGIIFINQWRDGIGSTPNTPRSMPGGKLQRHYYTNEIEFYNKEVIAAAASSETMQLVSHNEHTFKIHKNKVGNSIREGDFRVVRSYTQDLTPGTIDDFDTVTTYAKKFGLVSSNPKTGWSLIDPETGEILPFDKKDNVTDYLVDNPVTFDLVKKAIIGKARLVQGLPEKGWY